MYLIDRKKNESVFLFDAFKQPLGIVKVHSIAKQFFGVKLIFICQKNVAIWRNELIPTLSSPRPCRSGNHTALVLAQHTGESISLFLDDALEPFAEVKCVRIKGKEVKLGFTADRKAVIITRDDEEETRLKWLAKQEAMVVS